MVIRPPAEAIIEPDEAGLGDTVAPDATVGDAVSPDPTVGEAVTASSSKTSTGACEGTSEKSNPREPAEGDGLGAYDPLVVGLTVKPLDTTVGAPVVVGASVIVMIGVTVGPSV